jgi:hypothetical protein
VLTGFPAPTAERRQAWPLHRPDFGMPINVVRTPEDEIAWERAKEKAREEYPDADGERFFRLVMAIYKKMTHYRPRSRTRWRELR